MSARWPLWRNNNDWHHPDVVILSALFWVFSTRPMRSRLETRLASNSLSAFCACANDRSSRSTSDDDSCGARRSIIGCEASTVTSSLPWLQPNRGPESVLRRALGWGQKRPERWGLKEQKRVFSRHQLAIIMRAIYSTMTFNAVLQSNGHLNSVIIVVTAFVYLISTNQFFTPILFMIRMKLWHIGATIDQCQVHC